MPPSIILTWVGHNLAWHRQCHGASRLAHFNAFARHTPNINFPPRDLTVKDSKYLSHVLWQHCMSNTYPSNVLCSTKYYGKNVTKRYEKRVCLCFLTSSNSACAEATSIALFAYNDWPKKIFITCTTFYPPSPLYYLFINGHTMLYRTMYTMRYCFQQVLYNMYLAWILADIMGCNRYYAILES